MLQIVRFVMGITMFFMLVACGGGGNSGDHDTSTVTNTNENLNTEISQLPPDPGEEGKLTVVGVDSDDDGVRDDVQIAIEDFYASKMDTKQVVLSLAKEMQNVFIAQSIGDVQEEHLQKIAKAIDCITLMSSNPLKDIIFVEFAMVNTEEREEAYIDINSKVVGNFFLTDDVENSCQN